MKVLIACPVKDRDWILPNYLQSVLELDYPKELIDIYWIVNNSSDNSLLMLESFRDQFVDSYNSITIAVLNDKTIPNDTRTQEIRRQHTYDWLAKLRNMMLDKCVALDCDYLLSSDCDILLNAGTIQRLMSHDQHCVSALVYNGYLHRPKGVGPNYSPIENAHLYPNCLVWNEDEKIYKHIRSRRTSNPELNTYGHLLVVHFTGACILISKELASKARYSYFNRGEDEPFCRMAREKGYNVFCDVSLLNAHIMSPLLLKLYMDGLLPKFF
jgi:cellulose synthase/poly-beta-1,6-N-acetylglucosamine synthase-like glycosyltransferase